MEEDGRGCVADKLPDCPAVEDEEDNGFSFPVPPLAADECIVPLYPIFGRLAAPVSPPVPAREEAEEEPETATLRVPLGRLLLEEREFRARQQGGRSISARHTEEEDDDEASAGADEELEGVPPESYCLWAPGGQAASAPVSPRRCRKSGSTGSVLRWRRISDRLVGRSHSDGKEKFVFFNASTAGATALPPPPNKDEPEGGGGGVSSKGDVVSDAGWPLRYYARGGGGGGGVSSKGDVVSDAGWPLRYYARGGGDARRRSYLPYKQDLVGLFANVGGLRRSYHPF
jgi:hypothetical protein